MSREEFQIDRQYLVDLLAALKELRRKKAGELQELELWQSRLALARRNGREDLSTAATEQLEARSPGFEQLKTEERRLLTEIDTARRNYNKSKTRVDITGDAASLLRELEELAGKPDELEQAAREAAAETELESLRRRVSGKETE